MLNSVINHTELKHFSLPDYRKEIEKELKNVCYEVLDMISELLAALDESIDPADGIKLRYLEMRGDYQRYLEEIRAIDMGEAGKSYSAAMDIAAGFEPTDPIRLELALKLSAYYHETLDDPAKACKQIRTALQDAMPELDNMVQDTFKDSMRLIKKLTDESKLWNC